MTQEGNASLRLSKQEKEKKMFSLPAWWWTGVSAIQFVSSEFLLDFAQTCACQNNQQGEIKNTHCI